MKKVDKYPAEPSNIMTAIASEKALSDALFLSIGEGAIATDARGRISRANKVALDLLGFKEADLIGGWFPDTIVAVDENGNDILPIERAITRAFITGSAITTRYFYRKKDCSLLPVTVTVSPVILEGKPVGAIEVFRDITEELKVDRMKSEFISIASHQLRTPATAVKTYIAMLKEGYAGDLNEQQMIFAEQAYGNNQRQLDIVNDLLFIATTEARSLVLRKEEVDLRLLVKEVVEQHKESVSEKDQHLQIDLLNDPVLHVVDPSYFKMVIDNLLSNAIKYTPEGGKLSVKVRELKNFVKLSVSDTGVGIADTDRDKLFKKFTRIDNSMSSTVEGSGLGLYLLKQIVDLHEGEITIKSAKGKGSTFTVVLPKSSES